MNDGKWDKLPYHLNTPAGVRSHVLFSNFEATDSSWFDTGQYAVTENGATLGNIGTRRAGA